MSIRRLIFIMLAAIGLLLPTDVSAAGRNASGILGSASLQSIDQNEARPQWSDLGMDNVLATSGQSTVAPPSPVRLASSGRRLQGGNGHTSGVSPTVLVRAACNYRFVQRTPRFRSAWSRGYLYIIRCLRL